MGAGHETLGAREPAHCPACENPMQGDEELIACIEDVRRRNNTLWMDMVRLALRMAPEEARGLFRRIGENDAEVVRLTSLLAEGDPPSAHPMATGI